jgi:hypothetical protein
VSKLVALKPLGLALSEKQIPQVVENREVEINKKKLWNGLLCAQGRCATRLRYAPTFYISHFKPLRDLPQEPLSSTVAKPCQNLTESPNRDKTTDPMISRA